MDIKLAEEFQGIDLAYDGNERGISTETDNAITRALFKFLKHKGFKVYKVNAPVVAYEGETITMATYKLHETEFNSNFREIQNFLDGARVVLLYYFVHEVRFSGEMDENWERIAGTEQVCEIRRVRLAKIT